MNRHTYKTSYVRSDHIPRRLDTLGTTGRLKIVSRFEWGDGRERDDRRRKGIQAGWGEWLKALFVKTVLVGEGLRRPIPHLSSRWNWKTTAGSRWTCFGVMVPRTLDYQTI